LSEGERREGKGFFFEKKKQKTFRIGGTGAFTGTGSNDQGFFCFFFVHKKEDPSYLAESPNRSIGVLSKITLSHPLPLML
jgi:hypothetical protein